MRATWDETYLAVARAMARRSECNQSQVGAVVVDRAKRIVATGYNGRPERHRSEEWHPSMDPDVGCARFCPRPLGGPKESCPSIHAEANALLWGERHQREGGEIYITRAPCLACAKLIANSGLWRAYWIDVPEDRDGRVEPVMQFLADARVSFYVFEKGEA